MNWEKESASYTDVIEQAQAIVTRVRFSNEAHWIQKIQLGDPYVFTTMLLSQLHELKSTQLDCSFISARGYPGIMLRHPLFTAPEGVLLTFNSLETVDYGGNARIQEEIQAIGDDGYPYWHSQQSMPWFYLPYLKSLCIWLRSMDGIIGVGDAKGSTRQSNLHQLHTLILPQLTVNEIEFTSLLSRTTALKIFHWGIAYKRGNEKALKTDQLSSNLWNLPATQSRSYH